MIACICKVCCLLNFAHDRGSSTEGWIYLDCPKDWSIMVRLAGHKL